MTVPSWRSGPARAEAAVSKTDEQFAAPSRREHRLRRARQTPVNLVVISVLAGIATIVVYLAFVRTFTGQSVDQLAWSGGPGRNADWHPTVNRRYELLSTVGLSLALVGVVLTGWIRRKPRMLAAAAVLVTGTWVSVQIIKTFLGRPFLTDVPGADEINTFPSGHTAAAAAIAGAALLVVAPRWRAITALVAGGGATAMGAMTLHAGWHRASDAIGAFTVELAWLAAVVVCLVWWRGRARHRDRPRGRWVRTVLGVLALTTGLWGGFGMARTALDVRGTDRTFTGSQARRAYRSSLLLVVAMGSLTTLVALVGLAEVELDPDDQSSIGSRSTGS